MITTKKRWIGLAAAIAAGFTVSAGGARPAASPPIGQAAPVPVKPAPLSARVALDARDVDIRVLYKTLFDAFGQDYALAPQVQGNVTLKLTEMPFQKSLESVARGSALPLTVGTENQVWTVRPNGESSPAASRRVVIASAPSPSSQYGDWKQVPRRMAAYLAVGGQKYAVLVNGPEDSPQAVTRLLQVGDLVPAGLAKQKPLRVTQISETGVTLAAESGKNTLTVPLRASDSVVGTVIPDMPLF